MYRILVAFFLLMPSSGSKAADVTRELSGKGILWVSSKEETSFAEKMGHARTSIDHLSRDTTGDRLFVQFNDRPYVYSLAIVSSNGIRVKDLPGKSRVNDREEPVFWLNRTLNTIQFA